MVHEESGDRQTLDHLLSVRLRQVQSFDEHIPYCRDLALPLDSLLHHLGVSLNLQFGAYFSVFKNNGRVLKYSRGLCLFYVVVRLHRLVDKRPNFAEDSSFEELNQRLAFAFRH